MTSITSLDSVLRAGLDAANSQSRPVEGEKLADARAQVLQGTVATKSLSLQPNDDTSAFTFDRGDDPNDTDDARLTKALRSLAEKFQAGQAAQAATEAETNDPTKAAATVQTDGQQLAFVGAFVGASTVSAPVATATSTTTTATTTTTTTAPAVQPTGTSSGSGSSTSNGQGWGKGGSK